MQRDGYTIEHEGRFFTPDGETERPALTNEERSKAEVAAWISNPPERYFMYIKEPTVGNMGEATTWVGDKLGTVHFGREYRSGFGDKRVPVTVYGTNGRTYHGTYYKSAGSYARVKMAKR